MHFLIHRVEPGTVYLDLFFEDEDNFRVILQKLSEQTNFLIHRYMYLEIHQYQPSPLH